MNTFVIHEDLLDELRAELFDDGKERVAFVLCGSRFNESQRKLIAHRVFTLPDNAYVERSKTSVIWKTSALDDLINQAIKQQLHIAKVHSHPGGGSFFSSLDDESDVEVFTSLHELLGGYHLGTSIVLTPDEPPLVRWIEQDMTFTQPDRLMIVGYNVEIHRHHFNDDIPDHAQRHAQLFGSATTSALRTISAAVIGASGTGSITIEQLARYGIGKLVIVDPEIIEDVNLNRVVNSTKRDTGRLKVDVMHEAVKKMGLGTIVEPWPVDLATQPEAVLAIANCDVLFGCVDSHEARYLLNRIANFYCIPYIDMGVFIDADGTGNVSHVQTGIHYFLPGKSTHIERGSISLERVRAEGLKRTNRSEYDKQRLLVRDDGQKYLTGADEEETRPAVISVNMAASCMAVMEFLARLHPFRAESSGRYARAAFSFVNMDPLFQAESEFDVSADGQKYLGRGDATPLLHLPSLSSK